MKFLKSRLGELLVTLPSLIWLFIFFLVPTLIIFALAFKPFDFYGGVGEGWTLETFKSLNTASYYAIVWRTIWLSILTTAICCLLALPMGYYLARANAQVRYLLLLLTILPFWSSFIVRIFAWKSLLHPEGMAKRILLFFHLVSEDTVLLYNSGAVLLVMVYSYLPFAILPIYAAASKFNFQLIEAALDLGLHRFQAFLKVFIPGIKKGLVTAILMVFIPSLGSYVIPDVVGGPSSEMIGNKIVQKTFTDRNLPQASALSALLTIAVLVPMASIAWLQRRVQKRKFFIRRGK
ncbi:MULTISPECIES: ABC transporter permease [Parachlamydia]|uniref:Putrescine transport system permease protein potH n=2 Tax=Parachlamydia acanthamoebae TaxID=83552 RepID=F8KW63_PARAV|nr:ABC transporter permease [Parachlamydia acanthamoebae]EFB40406.1 hypothetical protein pah_c205o041 [Parachlamydia acanthamoebae str. Hall's coccus]KIA78539.1 Putrescine transport system permease protein PotH [Parachlamydia acanthamoebae]CCB85710.1 putrescine transport system permease protein potH [Parachlamydia acanthamoebae UV-7]